MVTRAGIGPVEFVTILAVLALLAAVGLPAVGAEPQAEPQEYVLVTRLVELRLAIDTYWAEHDDFPGQEGAAQFERQLVFASDGGGVVGEGADYPLGPYLADGALPDNPFTGGNAVRIVSPLPGAPEGPEAWLYDPSTGQIRANAHGEAPDGSRLFDL